MRIIEENGKIINREGFKLKPKLFFGFNGYVGFTEINYCYLCPQW